MSARGSLRVWDLDTGKRLHNLAGHESEVRAVAVSADGRCAVSRGDDGTVRVWDLDEGVELAARLRSAGFSQDDTEKIMGENFMRVFTRAMPEEGRSC